MPIIERIREIKTLDDLTALLTAEDNLAGPPITINVSPDWKDSTRQAVYLYFPELSLDGVDEYASITEVGKRKKTAAETKFQKLLARVGYTDEEAAATVEKFFDLEEKIAAIPLTDLEAHENDTREDSYNPVTTEELAELTPDFPVMEFVKPYTDAGVDRFIVTDLEWFAGLNDLYTEENIEGFRAWLLYHTLDTANMSLDQECMEIEQEYIDTIMTSGAAEETLEKMAYNTCNGILGMAIGRMYAENYVTPETKQSITKMVDDVVAVYRERLRNNDWLGEETRANAIEKLDNLKIRVAYPDDWSPYDYSGLNFPEDGGIFEDFTAALQFSRAWNAKKAASPVNVNIWPTKPQEVNAYYTATDNSINIPAGILGGVFYEPESSEAEQMGGVGMMIGHEITHGFDTRGSEFDKDGNLKNWWTEEDHAAFKERTDKVAAYFGSIETLPGLYVDGDLTVTEAVADLGGMSCMLEIAGGIEDFDYPAFFSTFAKVWRDAESQESFEYFLQADEHPPGYVRTNATVQQAREFHDAYDVTEGDGMYMPPEDRLAVW